MPANPSMDPVEVALLKMVSLYPNESVNELTIATYLELLADIPAPLLVAAIMQCAAECKFMPKPAEIRERYASMRESVFRSPAEAWELVMREMRATGHSGRPNFDGDALVERVVKMVGWRNLCVSENISYERHTFLRLYEDLLKGATAREKLLPQTRKAILLERQDPKLLTGE